MCNVKFCGITCVLWATLLVSAGPVKAAEMGTEVTYQGNLTDGGGPITGPVDMKFTLYVTPTLGFQVGTTAIFDGQGGNGAPVDVADGLLTVSPDFGANVFDGTALWLEIEVRNPHDPTDTALYDTLDPRQPITAAPIALQTKGIFVEEPSGEVGIGTTTPTGSLHIRADNPITMMNLQNSGNGRVLINAVAGNSDPRFVLNHNKVNGEIQLSIANLPKLTVASSGNVGIGTTIPGEALDVVGNVHASGTIASGSSITIDGVSDEIRSNGNLELHVANGRVLRLEDNGAISGPNVIAGDSTNSVSGGKFEATISGGSQNSVTENNGTIGGGLGNIAGLSATVGGGVNNEAGNAATVAGGVNNIASGLHSVVGGGARNTVDFGDATIAGGRDNTVSGANSAICGGSDNQVLAQASSILGGSFNVASGEVVSIGGGGFNTASGLYGTVPGGSSNQAGGDYSFAAGRRAKVRDATTDGAGDADGDEGTFVWADSTFADFTSTGPDQFLIRAGGGVGIGTTSPSASLEVVEATLGDTVMIVNHKNTNAIVPNVLIVFERNGAAVGSIIEFGGIVTYGNFTGSHLAWSKRPIERGMLVGMTGENRYLNDYPGGEIIYGIHKSAVANQSNLLGTYLTAMGDGNDVIMASGNGDVWVVDTARDIRPGDDLISSHVAGHAMIDDRSQAVSHIIGRAAEGVDFSKVTDTVDGVKRKRISILFNAYTRENRGTAEYVTALEKRLARIEGILAKLNGGVQ